jgi:hypothetical protein
MKTKKELDVDVIGGSAPLTKEEERRISEIIKSRRAKQQATRQKSKAKMTPRKKVNT